MLKTLDIAYFRWSFAWAPVLLDRTGGRLQIALHRQATVTSVEAESILVEHDRLDGWLNYAYRALRASATDAHSKPVWTPPSRCPGYSM